MRENHPNDSTLNREISQASKIAAHWVEEGWVLGSHWMIGFLAPYISSCPRRLSNKRSFFLMASKMAFF
jgi:hypothetical protein